VASDPSRCSAHEVGNPVTVHCRPPVIGRVIKRVPSTTNDDNDGNYEVSLASLRQPR